MYTPPPFKPDRTDALTFAEARGFGTMCAWDGRRPIGSAVPFDLDYGRDGTPRLTCHLARQNPLLRLADGATSWMMAVSGADAYVSADWYVSPDQVPTWLYQAVHLTGTVTLLPDDDLGPHLDALSARFESWLAPKPVWTSAKMTAARLQAMKKAIVGLVMVVEEVEASFKLNQHKSDVDHTAVALALSKQSERGAVALANDMRSLRPHLFANAMVENNDVTTHEGTMV